MSHLNIKFPSPCSSIWKPSTTFPCQNSILTSLTKPTITSSANTRIQDNEYNSQSSSYSFSTYTISPTTLTFLARVMKCALCSSASFITKISSTPREKPCLRRNAVNNFENAVSNMLEHVPPCN